MAGTMTSRVGWTAIDTFSFLSRFTEKSLDAMGMFLLTFPFLINS